MSNQVIIGPLSLNSYTFWIGLCALPGLAWCVWRAGASWPDRLRAVDALLLIGACALAAGRAGYLALNAAYFAERPAEITLAPAAGLSEHAAIAGMLIGWRLAGRLRRPRPADLAALASLIGIGASIGCVSNACAYGREVFWTDGLLWAVRVDWPDAYQVSNPRLPAQVFMAVWLGVCMAGAGLASRGGDSALRPLAVWLLLFSAGDCLLQSGRADPTWLLFGWRAEQALDAALFALGVGLALARSTRRPPERVQ